jgi:DNA primase
MKKMTCSEARLIDMVEFLTDLGFQPQKIRNQDYWYCSPLREERTASFKVNRTRNIWYDFGEGKGGDIIDFGARYFKCSVAEEREFTRKLIGMANNLNQLAKACHQEGLLQTMVYFENYRSELDEILKKLMP